MTLFIKCKNCSERFDVESSATTRSELEDQWGRYFKKQCTGCLSTREYHVNNVRAEMNGTKLLYVAAFFIVIGGIFTIFLWDMGIFAGMSVILPLLAIGYYAKMKGENVSVFNRLMVKRDEGREEQ